MFKKIETNKEEQTTDAIMFERAVVVRFDQARIFATYPDGEVQSILWDDVRCVAIETNDGGPLTSDVWWLLEGKENRCTYPQGAVGDTEALKEFEHRFDKFNYTAVIDAMGSTDTARFVCWEDSRTPQ